MKFKCDYFDLFLEISISLLLIVIGVFILLFCVESVSINGVIFLFITCVIAAIINNLEIVEVKTKKSVKKLKKAYPEHGVRNTPFKNETT